MTVRISCWFWQNLADDSAYALQPTSFVEIALSHTISEVSALLHFTLKFKMVAKIGGKMFFHKNAIMLETAWDKAM